MVFKRKLGKEEVVVIEKVVKFVEFMHRGSEGHDYSHILEVAKHSINIAKRIKEPVDPFVLICGALLHDIGRIGSQAPELHGIDGGSRAEEFLESLIDDDYIIKKITRIVVRHSPKSMISPETVEEKVVYDADALDRLGVIGMIRGVMDKKGSIQEILDHKIKSRLNDYYKLHFEASKKLGKHLHEQTLIMARSLQKSLNERVSDIKKIESYKLILDES